MGDRTTAIKFYNAAFEAIKNKDYKEWATHAFGLLQSACLVDPTFGQGWADNGHSNADIDQWRELPLVGFLDLYKVPGIQLYSLQMDEHRQDLGFRNCDYCGKQFRAKTKNHYFCCQIHRELKYAGYKNPYR